MNRNKRVGLWAGLWGVGLVLTSGVGVAQPVIGATDGGRGAMNVGTDSGFMTVCSSLVALPGLQKFGEKPKWLFAAGAPDRVPYLEVPMD